VLPPVAVSTAWTGPVRRKRTRGPTASRVRTAREPTWARSPSSVPGPPTRRTAPEPPPWTAPPGTATLPRTPPQGATPPRTPPPGTAPPGTTPPWTLPPGTAALPRTPPPGTPPPPGGPRPRPTTGIQARRRPRWRSPWRSRRRTAPLRRWSAICPPRLPPSRLRPTPRTTALPPPTPPASPRPPQGCHAASDRPTWRHSYADNTRRTRPDPPTVS